jgi:hypothetical protein
LEQILADAQELVAAHANLRTGNPGRQYGLGALNRAVVVMCAAAWEAYVESVLIECVEALRPPNGPPGTWPSLNASVRSDVGRFNNPSSQKVRELFAASLGLSDVTASWKWTNCTPEQAVAHLDAFMKRRHQTAHGVDPRPNVHNKYTAWLPDFVRRLAGHTDDVLRSHVETVLGAKSPW